MSKIKELKEKRNDLLIKAAGILDKVEEETRALTADEEKEYNKYIEEADGLSRTIKALEERRQIDTGEPKDPTKEEEIRAFEQFCRGETRALKVGENGGLLPRSVANMIVDAMKDISPLFEQATRFNVKGELSIPVYDETSSAINAAYVDELTELTEKSGELKVVALKSYIVGAVSTISNKLINNSDFDIVGFIVGKMAKDLAEVAEKEGLTGASGKIKGIFPNVTKKITSTDNVLKADDIIKTQLSVPMGAQRNACWIMHPSTFANAMTLKTTDGQYLLIPDMVNGSGYRMLGKPVYLSDNAPEFAASANVMLYGDLTGYAYNMSKEIEVSILKEKYATQYGTGVIGYMEIDGAIIDQSKFAMLTMGAAA